MSIADVSELKVALKLTATPTAEELAVLNAVHLPVEQAIQDHIGGRPGYRVENSIRTEFYPRVHTGERQDADSLRFEPTGGGFLSPVHGGSSRILQLASLPARSIVEVRLDLDGRFGDRPGSFGPDTLLVLGVDYHLDKEEANYSPSGWLMRRGTWPAEPGTIRVQYSAGYFRSELDGNRDDSQFVTDASPIRSAVVAQVSHEFNRIVVSTWKKPKIGFAAGPLVSEKLGAYSYNIAVSGLTAALNNWSVDLVPGIVGRLLVYANYGRALV